MMDLPTVVLPQPLSPTSPSVSPLLMKNVDVVDRLDAPYRALEESSPDGEVLLHVDDIDEVAVFIHSLQPP